MAFEDYPLPLYRMPDKQGCYSTALAFGLTALQPGKPRTPDQLDKILGRNPGKQSFGGERQKGNFWLMDNGYVIENITPPGWPTPAELFGPDGTADKYCDMLRRANSSSNHIANARKNFADICEKYHQSRGRTESYQRRGLYKSIIAPLDGAVIKDRVMKGYFLLGGALKRSGGQAESVHAITFIRSPEEPSRIDMFYPLAKDAKEDRMPVMRHPNLVAPYIQRLHPLHGLLAVKRR